MPYPYFLDSSFYLFIYLDSNFDFFSINVLVIVNLLSFDSQYILWKDNTCTQSNLEEDNKLS